MKMIYSMAALLVCTSLASANVTVNGQGKMVYVPDLATITVGVGSKGKTAQEAWDKNNAVVKKLFEVLQANGVATKDSQTSNLSVNPEYTHPKDREPVLVGYAASYDLKVVVRKLGDLGRVLDDLVKNGANRNVGIGFGLANPEKLLDEARVAAVVDARRKADLYAGAAGAKLGRVLSISEVQVHHPQPLRFELATPDSAAALQIAQGQQELSVSITIVYAL